MIHVPDYMLEPPDDEPEVAFDCEVCGDPIYVGDDYYDLTGFGKVCEHCIEEARKYDAGC